MYSSSVVTVRPAPIAAYSPSFASSSSGSSSNNPKPAAAPKKLVAAATNTVKRKRSTTDDGAVSDVSDDSSSTPVSALSPATTVAPAATTAAATANGKRDGPKKKKANRACAHCQKSHLTCDDSRPCQRCIKRGMADKCTEGHRKKAKYLLDEQELDEMKKVKTTGAKRGSKTQSPSGTSSPTALSAPMSTLPATTTLAAPPPVPDLIALPTSEPFNPNDPLFNLSFDPSLAFGSEAATLEYSILSAILGNPSPEDDGNTLPLDALESLDAALDAAAAAGGVAGLGRSGLDSRVSPEPYAMGLLDTVIGGAGSSTTAPGTDLTSRVLEGSPEPYMESLHDAVFAPFAALTGPDPDESIPAGYRSAGPYSRADSPQLSIPPSETTLDGRRMPADGGFLIPTTYKESSGGGLLTPPLSHASTSPRTEAGPVVVTGSGNSVYDRVTVAYDYTGGYHALMKYLPTRFEKNDILRIVRALAIVRPSLIALQMPLTEEDEVFVEKCFQRSLLEFEKLISFSGTPTVGWRRTGEICLVGAEFSMLTDWTQEELVGGKKYIWELFENSSVVEYWENFAAHAFENTTQSVYSHCVLLKPDGVPVPCTFCFSIRRDIFDLPSLVIGQWLPLL